MSRTWKPAVTGAAWIKVPGLVQSSLVVINAHSAVTGDTILLKGYTDDARSALDTTVTLDIIPYGTAKVFDEKTLYWTFEFNTAGYLEVGGLFLGDHIISPSYEIGAKKRDVNSDRIELSATNQLYGLNAFQYREAQFLLPFVDKETEAVEIGDLWRTVGRANPFYLLQYPDRQDLSRVFYCSFTEEAMEWQEHEKNLAVYKDLPFNIREVF